MANKKNPWTIVPQKLCAWIKRVIVDISEPLHTTFLFNNYKPVMVYME